MAATTTRIRTARRRPPARRTPSARRRALAIGACAAAVLLGAIPATTGNAAGSGSTTTTTTPAATPAQEEFRTSLAAVLTDLRTAVDVAAADPGPQGASASHLADDRAALTKALELVATLTPDQLTVMQDAMGGNPSWRSVASAADRLVSASKAVAAPSQAVDTTTTTAPPGISPYTIATTTSCPAGPPPTQTEMKVLYYAYWAAAQVASAAQTVAGALPDGLEYTPFLAIAGATYGVAYGLALEWQYDLSLAMDCVNGGGTAKLWATLPVDPATGEITPVSDATTVERLRVANSGNSGALENAKTKLGVTSGDLNTVSGTLARADATAQAVAGLAANLITRVANLQAQLGAAGDGATDPGVGGPAPTGTANGLANTINAREDAALAATASLQDLSVRLEIEQSLTLGGSRTAVFALPAAKGGQLETVRSVVTSTIQNELAAGQAVSNAKALLDAGNAAFAKGQWDLAYQDFAAAYQKAVA